MCVRIGCRAVLASRGASRDWENHTGARGCSPCAVCPHGDQCEVCSAVRKAGLETAANLPKCSTPATSARRRCSNGEFATPQNSGRSWGKQVVWVCGIALFWMSWMGRWVEKEERCGQIRHSSPCKHGFNLSCSDHPSLRMSDDLQGAIQCIVDLVQKGSGGKEPSPIRCPLIGICNDL